MLKRISSLFYMVMLAPFVIATPNITKVTPTASFNDGEIVTVTGTGFGTKANSKPLLWWRADMGKNPSPLGRKHAWDGIFLGEASSTIVAPNSSQAYRHDLGIDSAGSLAVVFFNSDELYMFRKTYEDFDITKDHKNGTFNFKTLRLWSWADKNNAFLNAQGVEGPSFRLSNEYTDNTFWATGHNQKPYIWKREELVYRTSGINVKDGIFDYYVDGNLPYSETFINRDSSRPSKFDRLYQQQVSNGAQPNSWVYYDSLYVDDSWHRIILCSSSTWNSCSDMEVQIPTAWGNNTISFVINYGGLTTSHNIYLYIVDGNNVANNIGYNISTPNATNPPLPPILNVTPNN